MNEAQQAAAEELIEAHNAEEFTWRPDEFDPKSIIVKFDADGILPGIGYKEYRIFADGEVDG